MLSALLVMLGLAVVAVMAVVCLVGAVLHLALWVILLPFRLLGWILWIPFLIVKALIGAVVSLFVVLPLALIAIVGGVIVGVAGLTVTLLPIAAVALVIYLVLRATARPAAV